MKMSKKQAEGNVKYFPELFKISIRVCIHVEKQVKTVSSCPDSSDVWQEVAVQRKEYSQTCSNNSGCDGNVCLCWRSEGWPASQICCHADFQTRSNWNEEFAVNSVSNSFCQIKSAWHREPFRHWRGSKKTDMDMKRLMQRLLPFVRGNTGLPQTSGRSALISDLSAVQILTVEGRLQMQVSAREGGGLRLNRRMT